MCHVMKNHTKNIEARKREPIHISLHLTCIIKQIERLIQKIQRKPHPLYGPLQSSCYLGLFKQNYKFG